MVSVQSKSRGVLSLITDPTNDMDFNSQINNKTGHLHFINHDPSSQRINRQSRRIRKDEYEVEMPSSQQLLIVNRKIYNPMNGVLTLLYFCDLNCRNTLRFTPILRRFLREVSTMDEHNGLIQLVCVMNNNTEIDFNFMKHAIFSDLASESEYWILPFDYANRVALIRILSANKVPSLFIVNNKTGKVVTDLGIEAVECCSNVRETIDLWRHNLSGVDLSTAVMSQCQII